MIARISAPILMRAFQETEDRRHQIQGFHIEDTGKHYVRDLTLEPGQQTRWTQHGPKERYYELHRVMMEEIKRLQMLVVCEWLVENSPVTVTDI